MKKFLIFLAGALFFAMPVSIEAMCLGPGPESYLVASKTSAIADGSDSITITAHAGCNEASGWSYSNNDDLRLVVSGANVTPAQQNNNRAAVNFALTSTTAGNKSIQMQVYTDVEWGYPEKGQEWANIGSPLALTFTAPATPVQTPTSTKTTTPKQTQNTTPATATSSSVTETPVVAATLLKINEADFSVGQSYDKGEQITLSGKAAANSIVKLYIYSEVRTAETTADADGNWTYVISDLEAGDHRVEAEVIDGTGKTSEKVEIAKFSVVETASAENDQVPENKTNNMTYIIVAVALIGVVSLAVFLVLRRKKSRSLPEYSN